MPRTIPPIRPPAEAPSILTVAQEGGLATAYDLDPTSGWQVGVQALDLEQVSAFVWPPDYALADGVIPDGSGNQADPANINRAYLTTKPDPVYPSLAVFWPWTFGVDVGCSPPNFPPPGEDLDAWASQVITALSAREVSKELWNGYANQGHSLARDAVDLTPGGQVPLEFGMGLIMEAVAGPGTWHIPPVAEPKLRSLGLVEAQGLAPRGPGGWPLSFGPAYPRTGPVSSPWRLDTRQAAGYVGAAFSSAAATGTQVWIVGHAGRIEVAVRDVPEQFFGGIRHQQPLSGMREALRERRAIYRYSPAKVFAARVDLAL